MLNERGLAAAERQFRKGDGKGIRTRVAAAIEAYLAAAPASPSPAAPAMEPVAWDRLDAARPLPVARDELGRVVREAWVRWAKTQPNPKPSWLVPYHELPEADKEADRQIGETVARMTLVFDAASAALVAPPAPSGLDARTVEAAVVAGWNACRKSLYAVCEDIQEQADALRISAPVTTAAAEQHSKGYHAGSNFAAKSIARGFNSMEAMDDDNALAALRSLTQETTK